MTLFKLKDLRIGDRFEGADGQYWTVSLVQDGILNVIRTGRSHRGDITGEAGEKLVEVTNRDDELTLEQAVQNFYDAYMADVIEDIPPGRDIRTINTKGRT